MHLVAGVCLLYRICEFRSSRVVGLCFTGRKSRRGSGGVVKERREEKESERSLREHLGGALDHRLESGYTIPMWGSTLYDLKSQASALAPYKAAWK